MAWRGRGTPAFLLAMSLLLSGCETVPGTKSSSASSGVGSSAPAPRYNLVGYSPAFKAGYLDACANPRRRNAERFKSDTDYSMGWQDGASACRSR